MQHHHEWFTAFCCTDGSLAVIQQLRVQQTAEESSSCGSVHRHFAGDVHASVRASGIEGFVPPLLPLLPCWSVVIAASATGVSTKTGRGPRWVGRHGPAVASLGQQAPAPAQGGKSGREDLELRLPCSSKDVQDSNRLFGTQRHDHVRITSQWGQHRVRGFRTLQEVQKRGQWRAFSSVARYDKSSRLAADCHSLFLTFRNKLETLAQRAEGLLRGRLRIRKLTSG